MIRTFLIAAALVFASLGSASAGDFNYLTLRAGCQKLKDVSDEIICKKAVDGLKWSQDRILKMVTPQEITAATETYDRNREAFIKDFRGVWATSSQ
jgi:hypothetical protein